MGWDTLNEFNIRRSKIRTCIISHLTDQMNSTNLVSQTEESVHGIQMGKLFASSNRKTTP